MKSLARMGLIFVIIFFTFGIIMAIASFADPAAPFVITELGPPATVNTVAITLSVVFLFLLLLGFKQGVEGSRPAVYGSFAGAQFAVLTTLYRVFQVVDMTQATGKSQILVWLFVGAVSGFFSVLIYGIVQTQRGQIGEMLIRLPSKLVYAVLMLAGFVGFLFVVSIVVFASNYENISIGISLDELLKFALSNLEHLGWIGLLMWIAFLRGYIVLAVRALAAIGLASLFYLALAIVDVNVFQLATNLANNVTQMGQAVVFIGLGSIFFLEIIYVFAPEAGH